VSEENNIGGICIGERSKKKGVFLCLVIKILVYFGTP